MPDACLTFSGSTPGYGSHPALHHLSGSVRKGPLSGPGCPAATRIDLIRTKACTITAAIAVD